MPPKPKNLVEQLRNFCAYQERSRREVEQKLYQERVDPEMWDVLIQTLEAEGFLDEQRFAHAYTRGKFRIKSWGRNQIRQGLIAKGISNDLIEEALEAEIDAEDYQKALINLIRKQTSNADSEGVDAEFKRKAALMRKGYEFDEIRMAWERAHQDEEHNS